MSAIWSLSSQKKPTLSNDASNIANINVRLLPIKLLIGAAITTPRILAAWPIAK